MGPLEDDAFGAGAALADLQQRAAHLPNVVFVDMQPKERLPEVLEESARVRCELGYPIIVTAIKDLRRGRLSINELVAIAVLAAFATGDYKTAGVVAFFMLIGEMAIFSSSSGCA